MTCPHTMSVSLTRGQQPQHKMSPVWLLLTVAWVRGDGGGGAVSMVFAALTPLQRYTCLQLTSTFENSTPVLQYGYAEALGDGRGITAGIAGFTSGTGDMVVVVQEYTNNYPNNILAKYLPTLNKINNGQLPADDTADLNGLIADWATAAKDAAFRAEQDHQVDVMYFTPSQVHADQLNLQLPLARAQLYDTIIQHGDGTDGDSISAIISRTNTAAGGSPASNPPVNEATWFNTFLTTRYNDLYTPVNSATQTEWRASVDRVKAYQRIITTYGTNGLNLVLPISYTVYGDPYTLVDDFTPTSVTSSVTSSATGTGHAGSTPAPSGYTGSAPTPSASGPLLTPAPSVTGTAGTPATSPGPSGSPTSTPVVDVTSTGGSGGSSPSDAALNSSGSGNPSTMSMLAPGSSLFYGIIIGGAVLGVAVLAAVIWGLRRRALRQRLIQQNVDHIRQSNAPDPSPNYGNSSSRTGETTSYV